MSAKFHRQGKESVQLYWDNPLGINTQIYEIPPMNYNETDGILIYETTDNMCILNDCHSVKPTFRIICGDNISIISERILSLEGANNFRDAGGYETTDGLMLCWGKLYRSDHLNRLTKSDLDKIRQLNIKFVVDYRNENEVKNQPNAIWDDQVESFYFTPDASSAELAAKTSNDTEKIEFLLQLAKDSSNEYEINNSGTIMINQYRDFVHHPDSKKAFRDMLILLSKTGNLSVDQHCRGGKDRTGYGIALIQSLLGVKMELVFQDYMITNQLRAQRNLKRMKQYQSETNDDHVLNFLSSMMETRVEYLQASFDEIYNKYDTVIQYVQKELKIGNDIILNLRENFLTTYSGHSLNIN